MPQTNTTILISIENKIRLIKIKSYLDEKGNLHSMNKVIGHLLDIYDKYGE